jgi:hypothetical protein
MSLQIALATASGIGGISISSTSPAGAPELVPMVEAPGDSVVNFGGVDVGVTGGVVVGSIPSAPSGGGVPGSSISKVP